jgi:hypothetical protein
MNTLFNIGCFLFRLINWNHFRLKTEHDIPKPYYKRIIKLKGFRTALVENYCGQKSITRFYWKIGKFNI